ncbi:hypothetical protein ACFL01_02460 [Planctomycetota bacterium]
MTTLGRMYCPACGEKLAFVEEEVTQRAAQERKSERISDLQEQLIQWTALTFLVLVIAWCFKDYALRQPGADTPAFFYGPPVVGAGKASDMMVIGQGEGYLELGRSALRVPAAQTLEQKPTPDDDRKADINEVKKMAAADSVTVTIKGGRSMHGKLLGRTRTHVAIAKGDTIELLPADHVESIQQAPKDE